MNISQPSDTHTYACLSGGKNCSLFGKFGVPCFLETPVLRLALFPYYRRNVRIVIEVFTWIYSKLRVQINSMNALRGRPENILRQLNGCWSLRFCPLLSPLNGPEKYKNFLMFQFKRRCLNLLDISIQVAYSHHIRDITYL